MMSVGRGYRNLRRFLGTESGRVVSSAFVVIAAAVGGYAAYLWWPTPRADCETMAGRFQTELAQSDKDLKASAAAGAAARCAAYRSRVRALADVAKLPAACGRPPRVTGGWPSANDERKWYETLVFEECR